MLVDVPVAQGLDVYIFAGPTMLDAVERYNLFSGGGAMPPLWGLGIHYRGYARYGAEETARASPIAWGRSTCPAMSGSVEPGWQSKPIPVPSSGTPISFLIRTAFLKKCAL